MAGPPPIDKLRKLADYLDGTAVFVGSGASHAIGLVPDPGSTAGATRYLREDATWATPAGGGGGGTPGGSDTQVQFNDGGSFAGNSSLTFDKSTGRLTAGSFKLGGATITTDGAQAVIIGASGGVGGLANVTAASYGGYNYSFAIDGSLNLASSGAVKWTADGYYFTGADTGFGRAAAGVVKPTNGGAGLGAMDAMARNFTVGTLPAAGNKGRTAFATDGRKVGEGSGSGTGVPVYDDGTAWRRFSDDTTAAA